MFYSLFRKKIKKKRKRNIDKYRYTDKKGGKKRRKKGEKNTENWVYLM